MLLQLTIGDGDAFVVQMLEPRLDDELFLETDSARNGPMRFFLTRPPCCRHREEDLDQAAPCRGLPSTARRFQLE